MAIVKMQKFNLITFDEFQEDLLEKFQDFQEIELLLAETFYEGSSTPFSRVEVDEDSKEIEKQISQINWARRFLDQYLPKMSMLAALRQPPKSYTLRELSEHTQNYDWKKIHSELRQMDKRLRLIEQDRRDTSTEKSEALAQEEASIKEQLRNKREEYEALGLVAEYFTDLAIRRDSHEYLLESNHTVNIAGWIPVDKAERLKKTIESITEDSYFLDFAEVSEEEIDDVPILLKNGPLVKPFEGLVEMFNLPKYDEMDPTAFMAPFYVLAFGMMVADFGYGLLLFLATTIGKKIFNFKSGLRNSITMFQIASVPTMMWGLIYGNIFGFEFSFQLLSASQDITEILVLAVTFGYIQMMFGLMLNFYMLWKKKNDKLRAILQAGSWMFFLISALVIVLGMVVLNNSDLQRMGVIGLIISLVVIVIGGSLDGNTFAGKIGTGLYALMDVTNYLGDLISYTRLMALGVAGGSIAAAFNLIIGYLPTPARFTIGIVLFVLLHGLNIFLSYLSAYVHGIRLQYLEFFGKFFVGGGRAFKPIKASEEYVEVISEEKQQQGEE